MKWKFTGPGSSYCDWKSTKIREAPCIISTIKKENKRKKRKEYQKINKRILSNQKNKETFDVSQNRALCQVVWSLSNLYIKRKPTDSSRDSQGKPI